MPPWKQNWFQKTASDLLFGKPTPQQQAVLDGHDRFLENMARTEARLRAAAAARTQASQAAAETTTCSSSASSTSQSDLSSEPQIFPCGECSGSSYTIFSHDWLSDPENNLRILQLKPGAGREAVHGELLERRIASTHSSYEALSYRWEDVDRVEDPRDAAHIHMGAEIFPVSDSVLEALYRLRKVDRARNLWIDQICIVQQPLAPEEKELEWLEMQEEEMNEQLKTMGRIYSNSARTNIWLGPNLTKDELTAMGWLMAFKPLRDELQQFVELGSVQKAIEDRTYVSGYDHTAWKHNLLTAMTTLDGETLRSKGIKEAHLSPYLSDWRLKCILAFYQRPWFVRTWPVQEVVLSKKKKVYIGDKTIPWDCVGWYPTYFMHHFKHLDIEPDKLRGLEAAMWVDYYAGTYTDGFPLAAMLRATRRYKTGDPKDKVYALLGMIDYNLKTDGSRYDPDAGPVRSVPDEIDVDKTKTTVEVYFDIARYLLEKDHDLQMLAAKEHVPRGKELQIPSWIPRWNQPEEHTHIWLPNPGAENFQACSEPDPWVSCHQFDEGETLIYQCEVHGVKVAEVTHRFDYTGDWGSLAQVISSMADSDLGDCGAPRDELALVLTAGRAGDGHIVDRGDSSTAAVVGQHIDDFSALLMDLGEYQDELDCRGQGEAFKILTDHFRDSDSPAQRRAGAGEARKAPYAIRCHEGLRNRAVFRTDAVRFGVGPASLCEGDGVFVLRGGRVPFILRETAAESLRGTYQLVGECYLRGAMNGEFDTKVKALGALGGKIILV